MLTLSLVKECERKSRFLIRMLEEWFYKREMKAEMTVVVVVW
jgi:hypothetical protein